MFWTIVGIICVLIACVVGATGIKMLLASVILVIAFTLLGAITDSDFFLILVQAILAIAVIMIAVVLIIAIFKKD